MNARVVVRTSRHPVFIPCRGWPEHGWRGLIRLAAKHPEVLDDIREEPELASDRCLDQSIAIAMAEDGQDVDH